MKGYIWYSKATDVTGTKLAEALEIEHGSKKPSASKYDIVIGWGTKTKERIHLNGSLRNYPESDLQKKILNHPDSILGNRNKLRALNLMEGSGVAVAPFAGIEDVLTSRAPNVKLPLIGRTNYHQGGKGFWMCPTASHVREATNDGAQYFQNMIEIKDEYRLHVFGGKVIYAVKKVKRTKEEYKDAYIRQELERQKNLAERNDNDFDEETARLVIERMAKKKVADGANMLIRSNRLGWKFSHVKTVDENLNEEAVNSLKALGLDFGAVDCCIDTEDKPYIIEVNTGPGLEGTPFKAYVDEFKSAMQPKAKVKETTKPKAKSVSSTRSIKDEMLLKSTLLTELISKADENEAEALQSVFSKMFG